MANKLPWFTHDHDAHKDPEMRALIKAQGHAAHTIYWTLLECLHWHGKNDKLVMSINDFAHDSMTTIHKVRVLMTLLERMGKVVGRWSGDTLEIEIKKFRERQGKLKFKTPHTSAEDSFKTPQEEEGEEEREELTDIAPSALVLDPTEFTETAAKNECSKKRPGINSGGTQFQEFWSAYPNRKNKGAALRAWSKLNPDKSLMSQILNALRIQSQSQDWIRDGGRFIPHPASWLNGRRWEDDVANNVDLEGQRMRAATAAHVSLITEGEHF